METESVSVLISCIIRKIQVNLESSVAAKYFSDTKTALMCRMENAFFKDLEVADENNTNFAQRLTIEYAIWDFYLVFLIKKKKLYMLLGTCNSPFAF